MKKQILLAALAAALAVCAGCGTETYEAVASKAAEEAEAEDAAESTAEVSNGFGDEAGRDEEPAPAGTIFVYVCGAVAQSGVFELPSTARVYEAIEKAGGMTEEADERALNLAESLTDGQMIRVYTEEEAGEALPDALKGAASNDGGTGGLVNINTADAAGLMSLPGIGEARAAEIIRFREEHGPFGRIEDIMQVGGIKTALFGRIEALITV